MKIKTDWSLVHNVSRTISYKEIVRKSDVEEAKEVSPSVGELMAAAMAAAGRTSFLMGGKYACETDYLAASGAKFPDTVSEEELRIFNEQTMHEVMDENAEFERYRKIAKFFKQTA